MEMGTISNLVALAEEILGQKDSSAVYSREEFVSIVNNIFSRISLLAKWAVRTIIFN